MCRAKLFIKENGPNTDWKERGVGELKVLHSHDKSVSPNRTLTIEAPKRHRRFPRPRMVMRADQTHRLLLNSYILPGQKFIQENNTIKFMAVPQLLEDASMSDDEKHVDSESQLVLHALKVLFAC